MYVNDREQVNYHGFLAALRTKHGYSLKEVSAGICCESAMNRFEKGSRFPEKLMRDRLTARLGISCERFEDYLLPREYAIWEQRMRIVKAIEERDLNIAKAELQEYEQNPALDRINLQFVETMRYMILRIEGASEEELRDCIHRAIKYTVPNIRKHFEKGYLLSDQELNLILELISIDVPKKRTDDAHAWRLSEYEKLIAYIDASCWEKEQKEKLYPRIQKLISTEHKEDRQWEDFCYLYYENACYNIVEVIEVRRTMLKISRVRLSAGICSERAIIRLEREGVNPTIELTRRLFERLHLCGEYRHARVITTDVELLMQYIDAVALIENCEYEKATEEISLLEEKLQMDILQNKQEISRIKAVLNYKSGDINQEEFSKLLEEALEYTIPLSALHTKKKVHLTKNEMACICDLSNLER